MNTEQTEATVYEAAKRGALEALREGREPLPIALHITPENDLLLFALNGARNDTRKHLGQLIAELPYFALVNCLWFARGIPGDDRAPCERPDRREACMVQLYSGGKVVRRAVLHYRTENGRTITESDWIESEDIQSMKRIPGSIYPA
jgi:hypothetical protein